MARIPNRSPSSFSRWLSSSVSSLGPASNSAFLAFFNLINGKLEVCLQSSPWRHLLPAVKQHFNKARQNDQGKQSQEDDAVKVSLLEQSIQFIWSTHMYLYASCRFPNQLVADIVMNMCEKERAGGLSGPA